MKKIIFTSLLGLGLLLNGCSSSDDTITEVVDDPVIEVSLLEQEVKDAIVFMHHEERLAQEVYLNISADGIVPVPTLENIANNAEGVHVSQVDKLAVKYDLDISIYPEVVEPYVAINYPSGIYPIPELQELYDILYAKGILSTQDALEVGCMVEVTDVADLDRDIALAVGLDSPTDVITTFTSLRDASYSHYWAVNDAIVKGGVSEGCCILADFCKTEEEFPRI